MASIDLAIMSKVKVVNITSIVAPIDVDTNPIKSNLPFNFTSVLLDISVFRAKITPVIKKTATQQSRNKSTKNDHSNLNVRNGAPEKVPMTLKSVKKK